MQLTFATARMLCKNVEDQLRAIDHAAIEPALQIALLPRAEIAVENHQRRVNRRGFGADLFEFAFAKYAGGIYGVAHLQHTAHNLGIGAARQSR